MPEIWDAYNADGTLAGFDLVRGEPIPDGCYHLVVEIIVQHDDGTVLLMERDLSKPSYPGYYECSAGGAAQKGENAEQAALRELREETGIKANSLQHIHFNCGGKGLHHIYYCLTNCPKNSIQLQEGETISYRWVNKQEYLALKDRIVYWRKTLNLIEKFGKK